jgi:hypothetical protein
MTGQAIITLLRDVEDVLLNDDPSPAQAAAIRARLETAIRAYEPIKADQALIDRCNALLEGHEPYIWPVPIMKDDLKALLAMADKGTPIRQCDMA